MRILSSIVILLVASSLFSQKLDVEGDANFNNNQIKNVADPTDPQDATTKAYVDAMSEILLNAGINGVVQDIEGNLYKTLKIGTQVWMVENLKTTHYNNGTPIPNVTDKAAWENLSTPGFCWYDNDSTKYAKLFGTLYNYYVGADTNNRNVCPVGWHVPTFDNWNKLTFFLEADGHGYEGSGSDIGKSMAARFRWNSSVNPGDIGNNAGANNSSGFTGLPAGARDVNGTFGTINDQGWWWSSNYLNGNNSWYLHLYTGYGGTTWSSIDKRLGMSVRCVRD